MARTPDKEKKSWLAEPLAAGRATAFLRIALLLGGALAGALGQAELGDELSRLGQTLFGW